MHCVSLALRKCLSEAQLHGINNVRALQAVPCVTATMQLRSRSHESIFSSIPATRTNLSAHKLGGLVTPGCDLLVSVPLAYSKTRISWRGNIVLSLPVRRFISVYIKRLSWFSSRTVSRPEFYLCVSSRRVIATGTTAAVLFVYCDCVQTVLTIIRLIWRLH